MQGRAAPALMPDSQSSAMPLGEMTDLHQIHPMHKHSGDSAVTKAERLLCVTTEQRHTSLMSSRRKG